MKELQHQQPQRSTTTWLARAAAIALSPMRTGALVVAIARGSLGGSAGAGDARAKIDLDLTFLTGVAA